MERILIGKTELGKTKAGRVIANLYSTDTRLQFPELVLFDLSALATVGIDLEDLNDGPNHTRYYAYYTLSDKTTSRGNPYKDVHYLEPIGQPATATSVDTSALLAELREIKDMLRALLATTEDAIPDLCPHCKTHPCACDLINGTDDDAPPAGICPKCEEDPCVCHILDPLVNLITGELAGDAPPLAYEDGSLVGDNDAEQQAYSAYFTATRRAPKSLAALRNWATETGWSPQTERA